MTTQKKLEKNVARPGTNSAVDWLVSVLEPTVDEARDPGDMSPPREHENKSFHFLFDGFIGKAHNAALSSKEYYDKCCYNFRKAEEIDPDAEEMDTHKKGWAMLRAAKQLEAAKELRDFMDDAFQQVTGRCFNHKQWQDELPFNNKGKSKATPSAKQNLAAALGAARINTRTGS
jgi:hypothetical protein